jgi:hypothetical protein
VDDDGTGAASPSLLRRGSGLALGVVGIGVGALEREKVRAIVEARNGKAELDGGADWGGGGDFGGGGGGGCDSEVAQASLDDRSTLSTKGSNSSRTSGLITAFTTGVDGRLEPNASDASGSTGGGAAVVFGSSSIGASSHGFS